MVPILQTTRYLHNKIIKNLKLIWKLINSQFVFTSEVLTIYLKNNSEITKKTDKHYMFMLIVVGLLLLQQLVPWSVIPLRKKVNIYINVTCLKWREIPVWYIKTGLFIKKTNCAKNISKYHILYLSSNFLDKYYVLRHFPWRNTFRIWFISINALHIHKIPYILLTQ